MKVARLYNPRREFGMVGYAARKKYISFWSLLFILLRLLRLKNKSRVTTSPYESIT